MDKSKLEDANNQTYSLKEAKFIKLLETESPKKIVNYTSNYLVKVYPSVTRVSSSNIDPVHFWNYGIQIGKKKKPSYVCS